MKFRKKPIVVDVIIYDGGNYKEVAKFVGRIYQCCNSKDIEIPTLEGIMRASVGDAIIKGVKGEFYPIKNDIFLETYEPVDERDEIKSLACEFCVRIYGESCNKHKNRCIHSKWLEDKIIAWHDEKIRPIREIYDVYKSMITPKILHPFENSLFGKRLKACANNKRS